MRVVLDTNVLVSGLLNANGSPGKIVDLILDGRIQVVYDNRILGEYEDVLSRPLLRIIPASAKAVISYIELAGLYIDATPSLKKGYPDADDLTFVEVFFSSHADALITGNLRHFRPLIEQQFPVMLPAGFLEFYLKK